MSLQGQPDLDGSRFAVTGPGVIGPGMIELGAVGLGAVGLGAVGSDVVGSREPGWFGRLVTPSTGGRPATVAFGLGALGLVAFVASMVLDWQKVVVRSTDNSQFGDTPSTQTVVLKAGLGSIDMMSLVYLGGMVGLLGLAGMAVVNPAMAARVRLAAAGAGGGVLAILLAVTLRLPHMILGLQGTMEALYGGISPDLQNRMTSSYGPGLFCGYAAVLATVAAIWMSARPAARPKKAKAALGEQPTSRAEPTSWAEPMSRPEPTWTESTRTEPGLRTEQTSHPEPTSRITVLGSEPISQYLPPRDSWSR